MNTKLRSTEDCEFGRGEEVDHNTFVLADGYEKGIVQHYFDLGEIGVLFAGFKVFDIELHEERFPDSFTVDKAYLQSSGQMKKRYFDLSKHITLAPKYSKWYVSAEKG